MSYKLIRLSAGIEERVDIPGRLLLVDSVTTGQGVDIALLRNGTPSPTIPGRMPGFRLVEDFGGVILKSALDCEVGIFLSINDVQLGGTAGGAVLVPEGVAITNGLANSIPVTLTSSSNTTPIPVSLSSIRINNTAAQPIPVNFAGTVAPVLGVVTVDNTNAEAIPVQQKPGEKFEVNVANVSLPVTIAQTLNVKDVACSAIVNLAPISAGIAAVPLVADATLRRLRVRNGHATATIAIGGAGITLASAAVVLLPGDVWNETDAAGAAWFVVSDTAATPVQMQGLK